MARISVPYLKLRDGRPRWEPGPRLRAAGVKGRDLKDASGRWLPLQAAIEAARALNAQITQGRTEGRIPTHIKRPRTSGLTCAMVWDQYLTSPAFARLGPDTQDDYRRKAAVWLDEIGDAPLASITKPIVYSMWETMHAERGHHMANAVVTVLRLTMSYAERKGWRPAGTNPARELQLAQPAPRQVMWSPRECAHIVATADRMGLPSIGDAIVLALHTGQRQGDILAMPPKIVDGDRIALTQMKRGALFDAPMTRELQGRMQALKARWHADAVIARPTLIAREGDGQAYLADHFRHVFASVRNEAAATPGFEAIAGKRFQDYRDTAVTRLALAQCKTHQIAAITGHAIGTVHAIMKHYLVLQPEMADQAIDLLQAWLEREAVAI